MGNYIAIFSALFLVWFVTHEYSTSAVYTPVEHKYTREQQARMDDLIAGLTPLHTADLGEGF